MQVVIVTLIFAKRDGFEKYAQSLWDGMTDKNRVDFQKNVLVLANCRITAVVLVILQLHLRDAHFQHFAKLSL